MQSIRNIKRYEYNKLRQQVRHNIMLNSKVALEKRSVLADKTILMGGIVLKKTTRVQCACNGKYNVTEAVPVNKVEENPSKYKTTGNLSVQLYLFDFAGEFEALFLDQPKEVYEKLSAVEEGDVVYALCKFIPINSPEGYFVLGNAVYYQEDLCNIKDNIATIKHEIDKIKVTDVEESPSFVLDHSRHTIDTIRLFLKKNYQIDHYDYYWLAQVVYDVHGALPEQKSIDLLTKYFCKFCGYSLSDLEKANVKKEFLWFYPKLKSSLE